MATPRPGTQHESPRGAAPSPTKFLIAVHGIGDQTAYETIQAVALRVSSYCGRAAATPLGRFYSARASGQQPAAAIEPGPVLMTDPDDPTELKDIGLAEAYWAPIPRTVATQKFVLEETKKWARSIAARVAYRGSANQGWDDKKVERLVVVLDEMVDTLRILERLSFVADKAGVFKFEIGKLLVDFVGDVQLVADFEAYREQILTRIDTTMTAALALAPAGAPGELYIVAHSEGTVVTFIALLHALNDPDKYPWICNVRGLMTIGSPIEVHHLLWPDLWQNRGLTPATARIRELRDGEALEIPWHNYMDFGDPIAYELRSTEAWLTDTGFARHLKPTSHEFSRYPLPGKAHVDYWNDKRVFGHFLHNVVKPHRRVPGRERHDAFRDVRSRVSARIVAWCLPYLLVAALLFTGVYVLEHAVAGAGGSELSAAQVARDVIGIGMLLFGITAAARLPRISDDRRWSALGWVFLLATMMVYGLVAFPATQAMMGRRLVTVLGSSAQCLPFVGSLSLGCANGGAGVGVNVIAVWSIAAAVVLVSIAWALFFPKRGHYMLPACGLLAAVGIIATIFFDPPGARSVAHVASAGAAASDESPSLWPLVLGGAAFFYLWWLSALLFDLVFVWQRYIRNSAVRLHLERIGASPRQAAE